MHLSELIDDDAVVAELGDRLARFRTARGLTQDDFAGVAGVARSTVQRLERGESIQLRSFVKLLRALDRLDAVEVVLPARVRSPLVDLERERARRLRVRHRQDVQEKSPEPEPPWTWGEQSGSS